MEEQVLKEIELLKRFKDLIMSGKLRLNYGINEKPVSFSYSEELNPDDINKILSI